MYEKLLRIERQDDEGYEISNLTVSNGEDLNILIRTDYGKGEFFLTPEEAILLKDTIDKWLIEKEL